MEVQRWDLGESRGSALGAGSLFPMDGLSAVPAGRLRDGSLFAGLACRPFQQGGQIPELRGSVLRDSFLAVSSGGFGACGGPGEEIWRQVASLSGGEARAGRRSAAKEAVASLSGGQSRG